jgi:ATP-dependent helicase/nuclease subunit B
MQSFLQETVQKLLSRDTPISEYILILPSKRAGGSLQQILIANAKNNFFSPKILSIEEFVVEVAGLKPILKTELLVISHSVYNQIRETPFEEYLTWAETILNDFSEIDRHLVTPKEFFDYLNSIKVLEKWGVTAEETPLIKDYLAFWNTLYPFYIALNETLLQQQKGYQGMIYRKALEELEFYLVNHGATPHAFLGFNALNKAEQSLIQAFLEYGVTEVYWDIDTHFIQDPYHSASHFFRKYMKEWKYYQHNHIPQTNSHFGDNKLISILEAQTDIAQVKILGSLLEGLSDGELDNTAVVLADENLLIPLLYSLPPSVAKVNITMGYPLTSLPSVQFFQYWIETHHKPGSTLYYRTIQKLLNHSIGQYLVPKAKDLLAQLAQKNQTYLTLVDLKQQANPENNDIFDLLFDFNQPDPRKIISALKAILEELLRITKIPLIDRQAFIKLTEIFNEIELLDHRHPFLENSASLKNIFDSMLHNETLDFEGDAFSGLQIMGVLETRGLDFENLIMLSVNEGTLPTGKSNASFLTFDLKQQYDLPLHTEKDAIYAYHFFRLLQRCQKATFIYNAASGGLNTGEKSRFLRQLEINKHPNHQLILHNSTEKIVALTPAMSSYEKTEGVMEKIEKMAVNGFSPSSLTSYIRDPKQFYYQRILGINEVEEVEETVASNTLGTIVHETLEILYTPFLGKELKIESLLGCKPLIPSLMVQQFEKHFKMGDITRGKNLIIFEVAKRYVEKLIQWDVETIQEGQKIELLALELPLTIALTDLNLGYPVHLKGKVDRLDRCNGQVRIIDYKSGNVQPKDVEIVDWQNLIEDYKYSKAFQVLAYAYMYQKANIIEPLEAGIVSFKNMNAGFMKFAKKEKAGNSPKETSISSEILIAFEKQLFLLIREICDPNIPLVGKPV